MLDTHATDRLHESRANEGRVGETKEEVKTGEEEEEEEERAMTARSSCERYRY